MNENPINGLSRDQIKVFFDLIIQANDEQVKSLRGVLEGEVKKRALRGGNL